MGSSGDESSHNMAASTSGKTYEDRARRKEVKIVNISKYDKDQQLQFVMGKQDNTSATDSPLIRNCLDAMNLMSNVLKELSPKKQWHVGNDYPREEEDESDENVSEARVRANAHKKDRCVGSVTCASKHQKSRGCDGKRLNRRSKRRTPSSEMSSEDSGETSEDEHRRCGVGQRRDNDYLAQLDDR